MGQPAPHVPPDLVRSADSAHWGPTPRVEREDKTALRPPPLFRSVGLTGLSASLPPHRRLRSVLRGAGAVLPAASGDETTAWPRAPSSSSNTNTPGDSGRGFPLKDQVCSSSHTVCKDSLPDISTHRLQPRGEDQVRGPNTLTLALASSQAHADRGKHVRLRPNISLSSKGPIPVRTVRRSTVSPLPQDDVRMSARPGEKRERWRRRKVSTTVTHSRSERRLTPERSPEDAMCQWLSSLGIVERTREQRAPARAASKLPCRPGGKETRPTRRDRRPHFLPPISQSDFLLNVPLVLPENSPPPSPSCVSSTPFFPLHVPTLPPWTEHRLKHT